MKNKEMLGYLFIGFPLLIQFPFGILVSTFGYPDILRQPSGIIMTNFFNGGWKLQAVWYLYAMSLLVFLAAIFRFQKVASDQIRTVNKIALFSGVIQLIALLRWTFLVPVLAAKYHEASETTLKQLIEVVYQVQNSFFGVGLGEHLGQLSMSIWTFMISIYLSKQFRTTKLLGLLSSVIFLLGLSEHIATAFGTSVQDIDKLAAAAFMLWSAWMIILGINILKINKLEDLWPTLDK